MWPEIEAAKNENRREIKLSGSKISNQIENDGFDEMLFQLKQLNLLNVNNTTITAIPEEIGNLENLQTLMLFKNQIQSVPIAVSQLNKLKVIDFSNNKIEVIPSELKSLTQLNTLLLSNNCIKEFTGLSNIPLHILDLSNNQLCKFPEVSKEIAELRLNINQIRDIPDTVDQLTHLKHLDLRENKIETVPKTLASISKLKEFHLSGNPLKDKRLLKLVEQSHKSVLDYVKKNGRDKAKDAATDNNAEDETLKSKSQSVNNKIIIGKYDEKRNFQIIYSPEVKNVRQHILCCLIKDVTFTAVNFKEFLAIQTRLHDSLCGRRENATIATHDIDKIKTNSVKFTAKDKNAIRIVPLGRHTEVTADKFYNDLKNEAEHYRKEKKRQGLTGIYKFLGLLKGDIFACIEDANGVVLSLPPLTNSDSSKITTDTKNILVEVTSNVSANICKQVMESLIEKSLLINLCTSEKTELHLEQIKIFNHEGSMKTVYPSKIDLTDFDQKNIIIERI